MVILINGSINSGKSTAARQLVKLLPNTAHVEVDTLRDFIRCLPLDEAIPINLENAACVANNLAKRGLNVVITYPLGQEDFDYLMSELTPLSTPIHTFTLSPVLSVAASNRGRRKLSEHEMRRVHEQYANGRNRPPYPSYIIDNTSLTPRQTATEILKRVSESRDMPRNSQS